MKRWISVCAMLALACFAAADDHVAAGIAWAAGAVGFPAIDGNAVLQHTRVLSSAEFEGRFPGTKGEDLTVAYIENQFKKLGLKPGNTDGTYIQKVPMVGITPDPTMTLALNSGKEESRLKFLVDFVAWTRREVPTVSLENSPLVFVGYGVQAPEYNWDDFKGVDLRGKTLVMLVNDPPVPDPKDASKLDPKVFGGDAMTYYGRWTYKYHIGAEKGAAGVLLVHETGPAGYAWSVVQGFSGERFTLVTPDKNMSKASVEGWISLEQAKRLFTMAGKDLEALKKQAVSRSFRPVPLSVAASITMHIRMRTIQSRNVVARVEGSDPKLKEEYVVYTAHWDHLGIGKPVNGDKIYHGAVDNAVAVGGLIEIAKAFSSLSVPPKRSILFLAVTAEEQGLLGSEYYATHPIYPLFKTLADINLEGLNVHGKTRDVTIIGLGNSDLDDYMREVAFSQGRVLQPDPEPEKGFYYRSDHFPFAKQGVPALEADRGIDFIGKPADYGRRIRDDYNAHDYHKPSDIVKSDWDMSGGVQDLQLFWMVGYKVAVADRYPQWKPGTEFKAKRDAQLKAAGVQK
ncbi:MAG: M28 family peptidase [Acidobacteriia bacterium]|nr:M28 family peptidase [Terriglobia bacterium]